MKVGFIGLGNMGRPMAANLLRSGFELTVWNRTRSRAEELASRGAKIAASPADLVRRADVVLACLADVAASRSIFLGEDGVVAAAGPGKLLADHSTVDLATSHAVHEAARAKGASFLDAPVSGGPQGAEEATLAIMAGGEAQAFEKARAVFEAMGKTVVHMGPAGAGTAAKLANQLLVGVHALAAAEALALARRAGVDLERLLAVLAHSWGQSRILERDAPRHLRRDWGPSAAPVRNLVKDLTIILELGAALDVPLPSAAEARRVFAGLAAEGKGLWDLSAAGLAIEGPEGER